MHFVAGEGYSVCADACYRLQPLRRRQHGFDIEKTIDGALVTKAVLRKSIDQMLDMIDSNEQLWDTESWPITPKD